jgi:hypothetical protein
MAQLKFNTLEPYTKLCFRQHPTHTYSARGKAMSKWLLRLFTLLILSACAETPTAPTPTLSPNIKIIQWSMGNIPTAFWTNGSGPSAVLNLYIYFESSILEASHLKTVTIRNSVDETRFWTYQGDSLASFFLTLPGTEEKVLALENLFTSTISENSSVLFLGTYTVTVELQGGESDTEEIVLTAPNSLETGSYKYIFSSEDYADTPTNDYVAMPKRATISSAKLNPAKTLITIKFSVDDDRIYSGWVNFYNQDGDFLGQLDDYFRNFSSGAIHPKLNAGISLNTDGTENILKVSLANIEKTAEFDLSDVTKVFVALSDGKQHESKAKRFNFYSYSMNLVD